MILSLGVGFLIHTPVNAIDIMTEACKNGGDSTTCKATGDNANKLMSNIINTLLFLLGAISTIMIVIGGIKYTTSNGDSNAIQSAKNTILYAIIGLVVAILASAIVNFVLSRL